jgi:hypothetical protein
VEKMTKALATFTCDGSAEEWVNTYVHNQIFHEKYLIEAALNIESTAIRIDKFTHNTVYLS